MKRVALLLLGSLLLGYLGLCALLFFSQRAIVFPAPTDRAGAPKFMKEIAVEGGTFMLTSLLEGDGPVVVHFHGNGEQVAHLGFLAREFNLRGVGFVAVEYPGYPGAGGEPSEASLLAAAEAALTALSTTHGVAKSRLVLEGQSVGTGVAVAMAAKGWGARLVLLSPYTSLPDVGARTFSWMPVRLLMRDRFDSLSRVQSVTVPTLVVHGRRDEVIPFELGAQLASAISRGELLAVDDAGHNDLWDRDQVIRRVMDFVIAK